MKIQLKPSNKDIEKIYKKYNVYIDWNLLSYSTTAVYNWVYPNRSKETKTISLKIKEEEGLAGWYYYGSSIYVNLKYNETFTEFIKTVFHEVRHWIQFKIDKRPALSMVKKKPVKWDCVDAEREAESWEEIGEKIFEMYNLLAYSKTIHK
ncbi:MAG: hypothetical protein ACO3UU_00825 [Minisyncoccia bacterium]